MERRVTLQTQHPAAAVVEILTTLALTLVVIDQHTHGAVRSFLRRAFEVEVPRPVRRVPDLDPETKDMLREIKHRVRREERP